MPKQALSVEGDDLVGWYQSSPQVRRGFCTRCGSTLFWEPSHRDWIGIAMGAFDKPTATELHVHIFVGDKGDYYTIGDGLPQWQ